MKLKVLTILFLFTAVWSYGQTITGKVTDQSGVPLPGVSIVVEGTTNGTSTDFDGNFIINARPGDKLIFSFIGLETLTVTLGSESTLSIIMKEDATQLGEVVVTALGIKKEKKSVGYAIQEIGADDLTRDNRGDVLGAIQGRVAGVTINASGGAAGAGSNIVIRGITSLNPNGDNQPLFIIDGIPVSNDTFTGSLLPSTGSNSPSSSEQFSFTNRGADINPNDVESVSILKGPAATALYGLRAANGAVVITTKRGASGDLKFNLRTSFGWNEVNKTPDVQRQYREGFNGEPVSFDDPTAPGGYRYADGFSFGFWSFGPEYGPEDRFFDNFRDFFRKGYSSNNSFNLSGGSDKLTYFASLSRIDDQGIVPNTFFDRTTLKFSANYKVSEKFSIEPSISYIISDGRLPNGGDKSVMSSLSYWSPTIDVNDYLVNGEEKNYTNGIVDNPRYFAEVSSLDSRVNRILANASFRYNPYNWLNLQFQVGVDNYHDNRRRFVPPDIDPGSAAQGFIVEEALNYNEINSNFFATFTHEFSEDFKGSLLLGNQITEITTRRVTNRAEGLNPNSLNEFDSANNFFNQVFGTKRQIVGLFSDLRLEYKNTLFLNITGRNDWSSTLPKENRSFFYPSVNLSYILSQTLKDQGMLPDFLTYAKFRASWAEVGKDAPAYLGIYFDEPLNFPFSDGNTNGFSRDTQGATANLKPERTEAYEFGTEMKFFNNRFGFDFTYYNQTSKDQILPVPVAQSSGFSTFVLNAGEIENRGYELLVNVVPVRNNDFQWSIDVNWSKVNSEVLSLPNEIDEIIFADSGFPGVISKLVVGGAPGDLFGFTYNYNDDGERIIEPDGLPRINTSERVKVGSAIPDWLGSVINTVSWRGVTLSFMLERKQGGDVYDSGQRNGIRNGVLAITGLRNQEVILDGVFADGTPNNVPVFIDQNYYRNSAVYNRASEILVEDASWWRLRNVTLSYDLPAKLMDKLPFDTATFSFTGTNLWLDTPFRGYDPEGTQFSAGSNAFGFTGLNIPNTKSYFFGVNLNF
ncbi:SusC/RagA family TonB-linked outer membrane protein [Ascidiimonas aurantiaca]|uniref:SusC/RagA family TonB-linked outer membrane protein n=1 Tax=Ascidiimonas aurantiaca TaxID=1685432 RepID=UPI0030EE1E13